MKVGIHDRVHRKVDRLHDRGYCCLFLEDAPVRQEIEFLRLRVARNSAARAFLAGYITWNGSKTLLLSPVIDVTVPVC